jgi:hypothetical protein
MAETDTGPNRQGSAMERFRVGRKVGRTIYRQTGQEPSDVDELVGVMDTPELAGLAVAGMNGAVDHLAAYQSGYGKGCADQAERDGAPRCSACDHLVSYHNARGCWNRVTKGGRGTLVCTCTAGPEGS